MGVDFDIIDKKGNLIDRHSLGWLIRNYNINFGSEYSKQSIKFIIKYCDEEIETLDNKINKLLYILDIWNENDFEKRKKLKINLISNIDQEEEFYSVLQYFSEFKVDEYDGLDRLVKLSDNSKLMSDFEYYSTHKYHFICFKQFLLKYINYDYEISY